jgi:DNA repair protein RecO (recombination protein O)
MEETFSTKAIIIKREPYREHDSRVLVYSQKKGKLDLVARGTSRQGSKLVAHIEPLSLVNIMVVKGKQKDYLGSAIVIDSFSDIKSNLESVRSVGETVAIFNRLIYGEHEDEKIFNLIHDYLLSARNNLNDSLWISSCFLLKLLAFLGYHPELYFCSNCQKKLEPGKNHFVPERGKIVCSNCSHGDPVIGDEEIKVLRLILGEDDLGTKKYQLEKKLLEKVSVIVKQMVENGVY